MRDQWHALVIDKNVARAPELDKCGSWNSPHGEYQSGIDEQLR
jgi:hypothetical protein